MSTLETGAKQYTILVVEDEPLLLMVVAETLRNWLPGA